jgi:hypothetical protein
MEEAMSEDKASAEEFRFSGDELMAKVKELLHDGNIRRIILQDDNGKTVISIPLAVGVFGALVAPRAAAVVAVAALLTHCTLVVERAEG